MAQSNYLYNKILEHLVGNRTFENTNTFHVALSFNVNGQTILEPSGSGYARVAVANNSSNWSSNTDGIVKNLTDISFAESTDSWGTETIKSIAIYDALTEGNLLYTGSLPTNMQKIIQNAVVVVIPTGSIEFGKVTE